MSSPTDKPRVRLPVRLVDGQWEFILGGQIPAKDGTSAELVLGRDSITDSDLLHILEQRATYRILEQGTPLLVSVFTKPEAQVSADLQANLIPFNKIWSKIAVPFIDSWMTSTPSFVEVALGEPTFDQQCRLNAEVGGLWLSTKGFEAVGLTSSSINLPTAVSKKPADSLNHALTILSEIYEAWRISHTGNIYKRVLYRERNTYWYPLEVLRNEALAKQEDGIAKELWEKLMQKMTRPPNTPRI